MNTDRGRKCLFLVMDEVAERRNVVQRVCEASKHPANPVLPLGRVDEWDGLQAMPWAGRTVLYDEDEKLFKCWYTGTDLSMEKWWASGYAVSEDGVHWVKPRLGLVEYNGSKDNNIVRRGWGPVIKDVAEGDESRRYKSMVMGPMPLADRGLRPAFSPDGIHWTEGERFQIPSSAKPTPDVVAFIRDEQDPDPTRRYKLVWQETRASNKSGPADVRVKCMAFSPDGLAFTPSRDNPILHPNDGPEQENHFLMLAPYEGQWVMPYECGWYCPNGQGVFGQYLADIRLAASTDGEHFRRVSATEKVISRGAHGRWDDAILVISDKPAIKDDTIYLFYAGAGEDWTGWAGDNIPPGFPHSVGSTRVGRMGLATLRRDGWTCLETADREIPGWAVTEPIEVTDRNVRLVLNVSEAQTLRSFVKVEVLDAASGEAIDGLDAGACCPVDRDGVRVEVSWRDRSLADVPAGRIRLRFCLCGAARLHAYSFC